MRAYERLLKYAAIETTSCEESETTPSSEKEFDLARALVEEMLSMGIEDARVDEHCYVYGTVPATPGYENVAAIGLIAHLDTAPDCSGKNVTPQLIPDYDGTDVALGTSGRVLSVKAFPHLANLKGRTLITTDGTTLLGADDKAGIAEILTAVEELKAEGTPHGKICLAFTPDEEIGSGAELLDLESFGAKYGYTMDGGPEGEIQYENFNAGYAFVTIHGFNVHPGEAKNIMRNAQKIAMEFHSMLPENACPECTEGYEGFFHLFDSHGSVEQAELRYLIRDHSSEKYAEKEALIQAIGEKLNAKYGAGTAEVKLVESYRNMREMVEPCMQIVNYAIAAWKEVGVEPIVAPIRGGTDGAQLSFRGLPCPNLGTGGYGYHGYYEHITVEAMDLSVQAVKKILQKFSEEKK